MYTVEFKAIIKIFVTLIKTKNLGIKKNYSLIVIRKLNKNYFSLK